VIRIKLNDTAGFMVETYAENDASTYNTYTWQMAPGKTWRFRHWVYRGTVYLDDYMEWTAGTQRGAFGYDALERLTSAAVTGAGYGLYSHTYTYDPLGNLTGKSDVGSYTYGAASPSGCTPGTPPSKPHAVAGVPGRSFGYDCTGNMVARPVNGTPYTLVYNPENQLAQVKQGSTVLASYTYDGDGVLVKKVAGGQTTVYVGPHYEKNLTTGVITKYFYLGSQRVALRQGGTPYYLHADHGFADEAWAARAWSQSPAVAYTVRCATMPMGRCAGAVGRCRRTGAIRGSARRRGWGSMTTWHVATTLILTASSVPIRLYLTRRIRKT
jgi:YD repeat-containing protein